MKKTITLAFILIQASASFSQVINGPDSVCAFDDGLVYSIAPVPLATSYIWELPAGAILIGPSNQNSISFDISGSSDSICVTPQFNGAAGNRSCKFIFVDILNASINGDSSICSGKVASINSITNGGIGPFTYKWSNGSLNQGQFVTPFADQVYSVTITDRLGCKDNTTHLISVVPSVQLIASDDVTIVPGSSTILTATGSTDYLWSPASSLSCFDCPSPQAFPIITTTYFVTSPNADQCTKGDSVTVTVDIYQNILVPTVFSPNGDGINDIWQVKGVDIESIRILIYSRWGNEVYVSTDINETWDGSQNGIISIPGVYTYLIEYRVIGTDFNLLKSGDISLIR